MEPHIDETTGGNYFPVGQYWAETVARSRHVDVDFAGNAAEVPAGSWLISCDPELYSGFEGSRRVERVIDSSERCVVERTAGSY